MSKNGMLENVTLNLSGMELLSLLVAFAPEAGVLFEHVQQIKIKFINNKQLGIKRLIKQMQIKDKA